ncbi:flavin reductase family protein [Thermodesulfobacteriota bacterium]
MTKKKIGPQTLLYPMPAVLVGTKIDNRPNFMTAAWSGIACSKPPCISVAIQPIRYTHKWILENQTFSINIPSADMVKEVDFCGIYSGKNDDKSAIFSVFYGDVETAPLIEECPLNFECNVIQSLELGSHTLFIGEVVETHVSDNCMTGRKIDTEKVDPLIFTASMRQYHRIGEAVAPAFSIGKK